MASPQSQFSHSPIVHLTTFTEFYQESAKIATLPPTTIIAEIAGKDSIAAVIQAAKNHDLSRVLGIGINHRSFYGNIAEPNEHFQFIEQNKTKLGIQITQFMYLDVSNLFDKLIIQTMAVVQKYFKYFSPCPACHLFFHMMRVPIARFYGITQLSPENAIFMAPERN